MTIEKKQASEALHVSKLYHQLWYEQELPIKLLEEFPWTNPSKREIHAEDKELLVQTIRHIEEHRNARRTAAERAHLHDRELY